MTDTPPQSPPTPSSMDLETVALVARAVAEKTMREMMRTRVLPATVLEFSGNVARVHVDGDPPETTVEAESTVSPAPFPDARVFVRFEPPDAVFIDSWITRPDTPGRVFWHSGTTPPAGSLVADGRAVGRVEYAALFAEIGTLYGAGDGSTTFNLPMAVDRFFAGAGGAYAVGATGGADSVTLTTAQMPKHLHAITQTGWTNHIDHGHHARSGIAAEAPYEGFQENAADFLTNEQGGGEPHENRPRYIAFLPCVTY